MKRTGGTPAGAASSQPGSTKKTVKPAQTTAKSSTSEPRAKAAHTTTTAKPQAAGAVKKAVPARTGKVSGGVSGKVTEKVTETVAEKVEEVAAVALAPADEKLLKKLKEERERLLRQAEELEAERRALAEDPEAAEMNSDLESGDCMATVEREKDVHLSGQIKDMLFSVDKAIRKLQSGTYGICEQCKATIPKARLAALPYAELCVSCQQKRERLQI